MHPSVPNTEPVRILVIHCKDRDMNPLYELVFFRVISYTAIAWNPDYVVWFSDTFNNSGSRLRKSTKANFFLQKHQLPLNQDKSRSKIMFSSKVGTYFCYVTNFLKIIAVLTLAGSSMFGLNKLHNSLVKSSKRL